MRSRRIGIAVALLGLAMIMGPASAAAGGSGANSVVGSGWRMGPDDVPRVEFRVAAQIGPGKPIGT